MGIPPELIQSKPITEIVMSPMELRYTKYVYGYLRSLGCQVTPAGFGHRIKLPEGTMEETYRGQSTTWTRKTVIRFPTGQALTKYVASQLPHIEVTTTMLAFPVEVLEPAN